MGKPYWWGGGANMQSRRQIALFLAGLITMFMILTLITQAVWATYEGIDLSFMHALLFVVETLSTTGYGELMPVQSPVTIAWAVFLIAVGFVVIFVFLSALVGRWLSARFRPVPPQRAPRQMEGHILICGTGPSACYLAEECRQAGLPCLVIDDQMEPLQELIRAGFTVMEGDARTVDGLQAAGIERARAVVATLDDSDNASVCLVTRSLRADLPLYALAEHAVNERFLLAAGATEAISAKRSVGERLGWLCTAPLSGQLDRLWKAGDGLSFCQVPVLPGSALMAPTLRAARVRERTGATILGLWSHGHFVPTLDPDTKLQPGHVLIAAGRPADLDRLLALSSAKGRELRPAGETVLVLGSGDVGLAAAASLRQSGIPFRGLSLRPPEEDPEWLEGDATSIEDLEAAGVATAGRCILALENDSEAVFATLMVRQVNPGIRIVARANSLETVPRLFMAGADNVLSVSEVGGSRLARLVLPPGAVPPSLDELESREVPVPARLTGKSLAQGQVSKLSGCIVLAVRAAGGALEVNPSPQRELAAGEELILFGTEAQFERFQSLFP